VLRLNQTQLHHWYQTVSAGEQFGIVTVTLEQGQRFFERRSTMVFE
jgi:hypothetical protein